MVNFIDFEKAFDSIDRDTLWKLLRHYGIPPKIVTLIQKMYDGTSCKVLNEGRLTHSFEIKTGMSAFTVPFHLGSRLVNEREHFRKHKWNSVDIMDPTG